MNSVDSWRQQESVYTNTAQKKVSGGLGYIY